MKGTDEISDLTNATDKKPTDNGEFGKSHNSPLSLCKHTKSNTIVLAKTNNLCASGKRGQTSQR